MATQSVFTEQPPSSGGGSKADITEKKEVRDRARIWLL